MPVTRSIIVSLCVMATLAVAVSTAAAQAITEFNIPTANSKPGLIVTGSDGNLWFTETNTNKIGRITTGGQITEFSTGLTANAGPAGIVAGPDGNLWFTENTVGKIGVITTSGTITEYALPAGSNSQPLDITLGHDGNLWFVEQNANNIGMITTSGTVTEYTIPTSGSQPLSIRVGGNGVLWFAEAAGNKIGMITYAGAITEYANPDSSASLRFVAEGGDGNIYFTEANVDMVGSIIATNGGSNLLGTYNGEFSPPTNNGPGLGYIGQGPDGGVWFIENKANNIGRISLASTGSGTPIITEYPIPTANSTPTAVASGPDGNLWFTQQGSNQIGKLVPPVTTSPMLGAVLPSSRSVQVGGNVATAFATMINNGSTALTKCGIKSLTNFSSAFSFQTTDPTTNALTGTVNTTVGLNAGQSQSFLVAFTPNGPNVPTNVVLSFVCKGVDPAQPYVGLNTFLVSNSATPVPDIVALSATTMSDGIVHIPSISGSGAFAVATVNVGASATSIVATANTGVVTLPLNLSICQTNPSTGQCLSGPGSSAVASINANATQTFSIFATATGAITFSPAINRVFVQFADSNGVVRGSTSVAVRTP